MRSRIACLSVALVLAARPLPATTIRVPGDAASIAAGLAAAGAGDTVEVACGTWTEHALQLRPGIVLRSATGDPDCTTIDAEGLERVLFLVGGGDSTEVRGLTLRGGFTTSHGGGFYGRDTDVRITDCRFERNRAGNWGGGVAFLGVSSPRLSGCEITGNSALYGGGLYCEVGAAELERCRFEDNESLRSGGGMQAWYPPSTPRLRDCTFVGNRSLIEPGGGLAVQYGSALVEACTFHANDAPQTGSGVLARQGASVTLERCLIAFGARSDAVGCRSGATVQVLCSDVHGNAGGDWVGCLEGLEGLGGNFTADPLFCDAPAGDLSLREDSPCLPEATGCGLVGAFGVGCGAVGVRVETWGAIKARYRN